MKQLGIDPYEVHRLKQIFQKKDLQMMPELYQQRNEEQSYISIYQQHHKHLEELMTLDNTKR